jgi:hypothetical protein
MPLREIRGLFVKNKFVFGPGTFKIGIVGREQQANSAARQPLISNGERLLF